MFKITHTQNKNSNYVVLKSADNESYAKIILDQGGSLQELRFDNKQIITDLKPLNYSKTYASAILFPFVNRINNGEYTFNNIKYDLAINHKAENHAIHGMVYDKTFALISQHVTKEGALVKLRYQEKNTSQGFPFKFNIELIYLLSKDSLKFEVVIQNTDTMAFPFSIGWHPYFKTRNIYDSYIKFNCDRKILLDKRMIPKGDEIINEKLKLQIKDKTFDDCFKLNNNEVILITPDYTIAIKGSEENSFLQIYTPIKRNSIAIEPTSSPADSFNNKIGIKILKPNEIYNLDWRINIE